MEEIVAAAVFGGGVIWSLPAPNRHHNVLWEMDRVGVDAILHGGPDAQGFVTSKGRFVTRDEAAEIAISAGQINSLQWPPYLYSEDLW